MTPDYSGLALGFSTSAAEEIQKPVPTAKVVKAFNTIFAQVLGAASGGTRAQVLYAGDDAGAKAVVRRLIESVGLEAVDAGPLPTIRAQRSKPRLLRSASLGSAARLLQFLLQSLRAKPGI